MQNVLTVNLEMNWANRTIWTGDNLPIMRGMNSESVDLIYLDPPFNSNANYAAPIGSVAAGAEFKDTWTLTDIDVAWLDLLADKPKQKSLWRVIQAAQNNSDKSYLIYMAVRLLEMHRLLKPTGSIYLHCDPTMSHYLKITMDSIFGRKNFRNEIVWRRTNRPKSAKFQLPSNHDIILYYGERKPINLEYLPLSKNQLAAYSKQDSLGYYKLAPAHAPGPRMGLSGMAWNGIDPPRGRHWAASVKQLPAAISLPHDWNEKDAHKRMDWMYENSLIEISKNNSVYYKQYSENAKGPHIDDIWTDIPFVAGNEDMGYPTQKPVALLERIIEASSNEEDVVFDPFCGCATTLVAADRKSRDWIGIDISKVAVSLVKNRIKADQGMFQDITARDDIPQRTDLEPIALYNSIENKKYLYGEQAGNCNGCKQHFELRNFHVDHIIARAKGGTDHMGNLQLLCGHCNSVKGDRGMEYLKAKLEL